MSSFFGVPSSGAISSDIWTATYGIDTDGYVSKTEEVAL